MVAVKARSKSSDRGTIVPGSQRLRLVLVADGGFGCAIDALEDDPWAPDVRAVESADGALRLVGSGWSPDIVVVDLLLPRLDCYAIVRALRSALAVPVLLAVPDESGFAGDPGPADGVVRRPLDLPTLLQATRTALRDGGAHERSTTAGDLRIFPHEGRVFARGRRMDLSRDETRLLAYLVERAGEPVGRRELVALLAGVSRDVDPRIVDVYVVRLMVHLSLWSSVSIERTPNREAFVLTPQSTSSLFAGLL